MQIAILGGSRFLGVHLAAAFVDRGWHVTLFNRGQTQLPVPLPNTVRCIHGDRDVPSHAARLFDRHYDAICDLSGYTLHQVAPFATAPHRARVGHYVFCSTSSVYQVPPPYRYSEGAPRTHAAGTYGGDKAAVEDALVQHWADDHWPVTILRPQGVFGPFDPAQTAFVLARLQSGSPVFKDAAIRSRLNLLFVNDFTACVIRALTMPASHGKIYNVAGDEAVTQENFVELCASVSGGRADIQLVSDWRNRLAPIGMVWPPSDLVADTTRIKQELGATFQPLRESLAATWAWLAAEPGRLRYQPSLGESYARQSRRTPLWRLGLIQMRRAAGKLRRG